MLNYLALFTVSAIGIFLLDEDPTQVSIQEWIFFIIMIYSAFALLRQFIDFKD